MKRFTKTLLSVAAVSAVSAAMAVSAMAEEVPMSASYAGDTVTLDNVKSTGAQQTLLILDGAETVVENADGSNNIVQIDQKDDGTVFATTKVGTLKDSTYYVRIGGYDGTLQTYKLTVGGATVDSKKIMIGDCNLSGGIDGKDTSAILRAVAGKSNVLGSKAGVKYSKVENGAIVQDAVVIVGDCNLSGGIDGKDTSAILRAVAGKSNVLGSKAGTEVEVTVNPIAE